MSNKYRFETMKKNLLKTGVYTIDELVVGWNCDPDDVRAFLRSSDANGYLIVLTDEQGNMVVPRFFFDSHLCLRVELGAMLRPLRLARFSSWKQWAWLASPERKTLNGIAPQAAIDMPNFQQKAVQAAYAVSGQTRTNALVLA